MFKIIPNKDKELCAAYRCQNARPKNDNLCPKHRKRQLKETKPVNYYFNLLRSNAMRRGKEFLLTLEEFEAFCLQTNYLELKGKQGKSASIDRIRPTEGYHKDNIQVLSLAENSSKMHTDRNNETPF